MEPHVSEHKLNQLLSALLLLLFLFYSPTLKFALKKNPLRSKSFSQIYRNPDTLETRDRCDQMSRLLCRPCLLRLVVSSQAVTSERK